MDIPDVQHEFAEGSPRRWGSRDPRRRQRSCRRDRPLEGRRARCRTGHEVADEDVAELVDHEIVEVTAALFGEIGERGQPAVGESPKTVILHEKSGDSPPGIDGGPEPVDVMA